METRTLQSDQITTTISSSRAEGGNSSADESCVSKKKAKKRDRSPNTDNEAVLPSSPSQPNQLPATTPGGVQQKKEKQRPETWNKLEQQIFFNALRQNGKNFESITQYFNARQKRFKVDDGVYVQRSKEQIRHFYYRTWHKIIKYISIPQPKNKNSTTPTTTQPSTSTAAAASANTLNVDCSVVSLRDIQVKCLIAFNVLMTKLHRWNKKSALKLVELINQGWTTIREKGKVTRLKMPICKDSTKTVQSDPDQTMTNEEAKGPIPFSISIQLEPKNENAYCRVHRLAQTPFLNIEIQTLQSVRYLIEFLENKWKNRRNQFLEKFNISEPRSFINVESNSTATATTEQENENDCNQKQKTVETSDNSLSNSSVNYFAENLTLFPNESLHKLKDIDLNEDLDETTKDTDNNLDESSRVKLKSTANDDQQESNNLGTSSPPKQPNLQHQMKPLVNRTNMIEQTMLMSDETMMIDDFALIATKATQKNCAGAETETSITANGNPSTVLFADQLRAGLNASNLKIVPDTKEFKDLTFAELYLALDKPEKISFKYDWISANRKPSCNGMNTNLKSQIATGSSSSISPSFGSFDFSKIQRQRFYIETLASVASSFLNSIQTAKQASSQSNNQESGLNQPENKSNSKNSKTDTNQKVANSTGQSKQQNAQAKSPQKTSAVSVQPPVPKTVTTQLPSPNVEATAAGAQTLDAALVRLNSQEQNSKTQKLLSDLNSKKRSRQRKQVMVVGNVGGNKHSPLPKLNLNMDLNQLSCQLNISPQSSNNSNNSTNEAIVTTQNIVYSGPVAAVARQIVNNSSLLTITPTTTANSVQSTNESLPQQNSIQSTSTVPSNSIDQQNLAINNNQHLLDSTSQSISSFQHALSAFMPNFLSSLTDNSSSNEENDIKYEQTEPVINGPTDTLTDMSLLGLPMNNADSLFGTSTNQNNNQPDNNQITQEKPQQNIVSNVITNGTANNSSIVLGAFSSVNNSKPQVKDNLNQLTPSMNSITSCSPFSSSNTHVKSESIDGNNMNQASGYSLLHKKSDVCEWTESMADVSLTGILTDIGQSPMKQSNNMTLPAYNENSNNSIYISMDTIMEIMPQAGPNRYDSRFDENSLIGNTNDRVSSNLQN